MKNTPKEIGTVSTQESSRFSTPVPWGPVTKPELPYSVLGTPNGFLFTHGSGLWLFADHLH